MPNVTIIFADDKAPQELKDWEAPLKSAFRLLDERLVADIVPITVRSEAAELFSDASRSIDLCIIDVKWQSMAGIESDAAEDLLRRSLDRKDAPSILISGGDGALLSYFYGLDKAHVRPHAVMHKEMYKAEREVVGVIEAAYSAAMLPLRSRVVEIVWDLSQAPNRAMPGVDPVAAAELACSVLNGPVDKVEIVPIGGGQSGATTLLIRGITWSNMGRPDIDHVMLKMEQDPRRLHAEIESHRRFVRFLPNNTFAPLKSSRVVSFGGWSAIAFAEASGRTAASIGARSLLTAGATARIFSSTLQTRLIKQAEQAEYSVAGLSESAQLTQDRLTRTVTHIEDLFSDGAVLDFFKQEIHVIFDSVARTSVYTIAHGDMHTRNVLVGDDAEVSWIDAASMQQASIWCADMARFFVWLVFGSPDDFDDNSDAEACIYSLGWQVPDLSPGNVRRDVHTEVLRLLRSFRMKLRQHRNWTIDIAADWRDSVCSELCRVTYSSQTFDTTMRKTAAEAAYLLLNDSRFLLDISD